MLANQAKPSSSTMTSTQEHIVRVPRAQKKKFSMIKFSSGTDVDFVKLCQTPVKIERENNLKDYKLANDLETQPKFGAGSEFGKDLKEEARRKKYGKLLKKYNPDDQPWYLKVGAGKQVKKYKGVREGTIGENTSYYIFTQCADGAFEAVPIEEWYNFSPVIRYKYLNSDEAEEEFTRRDKTLNMFSIMVKKRMNREEDKDLDLEEGEKKSKKKEKKEKDFLLTDMDDWAELSDEEEGDDEEDGEEKEDKKDNEEKKSMKGKKGKTVVKKKKNSKHNSDDEAVEESDEGDYDDREVDYITDSESSLSEPDEQEKTEKYEEKGVDEERGLRKLIDSEESSDEENKEEENDDEKEKPEKDKKDAGSESDSSSSSSASDSDIEKDASITSALLMQKKRTSPLTVTDKQSSSRSGTPTNFDDKKGLKRKMEGEAGSGKKPRTESPVFNSQSAMNLEGITEDSIRRYLARKPMTAKELVAKFKSKKLNMSNEQMTSAIAQLLKKINPEKSTVNNIMYLSLRKPE